ncbi:retrotransposon nucleocapsid protein [Curvularia clavata]|uniref:RNA-directed DNA polymerase n=1 Tax=Curvularia clavata TaxID=95742 RepID=A0A9Q9DNJ1_CURCL|nr:retrotransposon nucleocapsid protein [Curvularia clavata]
MPNPGDSQPTLTRDSTQPSSSELSEPAVTEADQAELAQRSPIQGSPARLEPPQTTIAQQLDELRAWRQRALDEQELKRLQEIKRRFDQGDTTALTEDLYEPHRAVGIQLEPNVGAPRPEKPTQFTSRDRAEYNRWERECEATFRGSPKTFQTEAVKIDFGLRYITDPLRSTWDAYYHDYCRKDTNWTPTWLDLKTVMVDSLGPPEQRKLEAHRALKHIRQDWSQDPNDLLAKLDTLWSELGNAYSEEQRVRDFMGALTMTIQKELLLLEPGQRSTISDLNARARLIWDRTKREKPSNARTTQNKQARSGTPPKNTRGYEKTLKKQRRNPADTKGSYAANKVRGRDAEGKIVCYNCGEPGHISRNCRAENLVALLSAHIARLELEEDLKTLREAMFSKPSPLLTITVQIGQDPLEALIDGGSQLNLLSIHQAKDHDLTITPIPNLVAEALSGVEFEIYGTTEVTMKVTDTRGRTKVQNIPFVVTEMKHYPVCLGMPWVDFYKPKISLRSRRVLFRGVKYVDRASYEKIATESAEEFEKTLRTPTTDVYALKVSTVMGWDPSDEEEDWEGLEKPKNAQVGPDQAKLPQLPPQYEDFADLASEEDAKCLAEHGPHDLVISLKEGTTPPHQPLYGLSKSELALLRDYLREYLARGWIRHSKSPAGAPILFAKKKDGTMRLCVDYRGLNNITLKNRHPLPLITESLDRLAEAKFYTKLDVREAYHRVRIKEGDEWKTAFRTRYGHFEYTVMPFGLTNAPAQFQAYIHHILAGLVDVSCIVYLDDILVFSNTEEEHERHVREVLNRLREAKLYLKTSKCEWHTQHTEFLGYTVSPEGISIDPDRAKTAQEWPEPRTVRDVRVFLGFMNYYRRFIANFSRIALPLTELLKKEPNAAKGGKAQRKEESVLLILDENAKSAFKTLKNSFTAVPILTHFNPDNQTRVQVDASGGAIAGILSQYVPKEACWRPVDFYSRKLIAAEYNYDTHDQELLAIVASLQHWRRYLDGIHFDLITDHRNLKWFMETKTLNHRQVRSYLALSGFDFTIVHQPGKTNPADGPSRRPDYIKAAQEPKQKNNSAYVPSLRHLLKFNAEGTAIAAAATTRSQGRQNTAAKQHEDQRHAALAQEADSETDEYTSDSCSSEEDDVAKPSPQRLKQGHSGPTVPKTAQEKAAALKQGHDDPLSGHFGARRTLEKLTRHYKWAGMRKDVEDYCKSCLICQKSTPKRHLPYGPLAPLPPPNRAWEEVTMDFITELPPSKLQGVVYDAILVIVDRLTKMAHYVPARSNWDGVDLAQAWLREVIRLHGVPRRIISDRGPLMNSTHWKTFLHYLNSKRVLTSAYHPQTDGRTERQNQTLEQYLRCYCSLEQDDWALWISVGEYAYNDSVHSTTKVTPFQACNGIHPRGAEWPKDAQTGGENPLAASTASRIIEIQQECKNNILKAQEYQKRHADKKRQPIPFKVGDKVLLSNKHIKSLRPKKKIDWKYVGPGTITEQIGPSAFKVDMPGLKNVHPVFHASLLEQYHPPGDIPHPEVPTQHELGETGDDVYLVDKIVGHRKNKDDQWEYLVKWTGYPDSENTWEPAANVTQKTLQEFWNKSNQVPRRRRGPKRAK